MCNATRLPPKREIGAKNAVKTNIAEIGARNVPQPWETAALEMRGALFFVL
jgi:hypothetical protein